MARRTGSNLDLQWYTDLEGVAGTSICDQVIGSKHTGNNMGLGLAPEVEGSLVCLRLLSVDSNASSR